MSDLIIFGVFFLGVAFGVIATLIYWPWVMPEFFDEGKK